MKFSTVAFFAASAIAGVVPEDNTSTAAAVDTTTKKMTTSTIYETRIVTVTDCGDEVTECPLDATKVVTETIAVSTTVCPEDDDEEPTYTETTPCETDGSYPTETETESVPCSTDGSETDGSSPEEPTYSEAPACPATSVRTITTSYTTVIPTTIVETFTVDCPTPTDVVTPPQPSGDSGCVGTNCTSPEEPVPAAAGSVVGSVFFAAVAGLAAFAFA